MREIWTEINGWKGYEVSNLGNVRSWFNTHGQIIGPKPIKCTLNYKNRPVIRVRRNGKKCTLAVHRLVLEAFVSPCPEGMQACHYDDNPLNNKLENLRWDTCKNNVLDGLRNQTAARGEKQRNAKLTGPEVLNIRERYFKGESTGSIAKDFGVSCTSIRGVTSGDTWKHIGGPIVARGVVR
jgi:hypothetical protein